MKTLWYQGNHNLTNIGKSLQWRQNERHQGFALLAFVRGIHRWPVDSPHKGQVTWKMFPQVTWKMFPWWRHHGNSRIPWLVQLHRMVLHDDDFNMNIWINNCMAPDNYQATLEPSMTDMSPSLVQTMAWCLPGTKAVPESILSNRESDDFNETSLGFESKYKITFNENAFENCSVQIVGYVLQASMS